MSEKYREKYREKYSDLLHEFLIEFMARCADAPCLMGTGHSAAAAPMSLVTAGGASPVQV